METINARSSKYARGATETLPQQYLEGIIILYMLLLFLYFIKFIHLLYTVNIFHVGMIVKVIVLTRFHKPVTGRFH